MLNVGILMQLQWGPLMHDRYKGAIIANLWFFSFLPLLYTTMTYISIWLNQGIVALGALKPNVTNRTKALLRLLKSPLYQGPKKRTKILIEEVRVLCPHKRAAFIRLSSSQCLTRETERIVVNQSSYCESPFENLSVHSGPWPIN